MWGIFCSSICLCSDGLVWVSLLVLPFPVCILFWRFVSDVGIIDDKLFQDLSLCVR